jgi:hypothetical protein
MIPGSVRPFLLALAIPLILPHSGWAQPATPAADSLWAVGDMAGAATAYRAALADHPDDPRIVLRLGIALYNTERYDEAVPLLEQAAEIHPTPAFANWFLAQTFAVTDRPADAIAALRLATANGAIPYPAVAANPALQSLAGDPDFDALMESIRPCTAPEYRQFDFWIGEWVVRNAAGQLAGTNTITREYDGCALVEHWQGAGGGMGTSQNFYHQGDGRWHQNWIDSQASNPLWLVGGLDDAGAMVMTDVDSTTTPMNRVTWTPNPDGSVRQHWEQSSDAGETWATVFDGLYVQRERAESP